jgi:two-component system, OmpR family, response regulator VicR
MARRPIILLVEDDPGTRHLMATLLDAEGYLVQSAGNGREALALLETEVPCAMVVDLDMPVMDGAELRRHQQDMASASSVPFILVSGAHNAEGIARELGIADVVAKPFDEAQLLRVIAAACHGLD